MSDALSLFASTFGSFRGNTTPAYRLPEGELSFASLYSGASALSNLLMHRGVGRERRPVIVYGHKDERYLIAYWGCIVAGRPLIPVEPSGLEWVQRVRNATGASIVLD